MEPYYWYYEIEIINEVHDLKKEINRGFTFGYNYADAIKNLESFYRDEMYDIHHLIALDLGSCIDFGLLKESEDFPFEVLPLKGKEKL